MDNRTDVTEDQQSTPEHTAFRNQAGTASSAPEVPNGAGLSAGPHNEPPQSRGIEDTYQEQPASGGSTNAAAQLVTNQSTAFGWKKLQQTLTQRPVQLAVSVLGVSLILLAIRGARSR